MYKSDTLKNGLKIVTKPMNYMESAAIAIWIRAGGRYENSSTSGISHLLEHLLFKGTVKRDMKAIKQEIEGRGGSFNGFTSEEFTCYLVKLLSKDIELGIDILSDMVLNPRLSSEEIQKEKNVIVEEINMYKDIPSQHVHEVLAELMWPNQPLGLPLAGTVESVKSLTKQNISEYKEAFYNPLNMLAICAGKVEEEHFAELCRKYLAPAVPKEVSKFSPVSYKQESPRLNLNYKDTEQTHVALGFHALDRFHPDKHALSILNVVLGANMSSRLFHVVRDELALCYEISSGVRKYEDAGAFTISAGVDDKKLLKALEVIMGILGSVKKEPVPGDELARAKEYYKGQLLLALEDTMSLMLWLGEKVIAGEKGLSVKKIMDSIDKVNQEDLMRVANSVFSEANLNLAVIGPVKDENKVREALRV